MIACFKTGLRVMWYEYVNYSIISLFNVERACLNVYMI